MMHGRYELLAADHAQIFAYTRTLGVQCLLVACNFSADRPEFPWPEALKDFSATLLLGNWPVQPQALSGDFCMRPFEARLYLLQGTAGA